MVREKLTHRVGFAGPALPASEWGARGCTVELDQILARRRMCRRFLDRPVDPATVDRLLARAARAPSAGNAQGWDWLVLEGPTDTRRFWELDADPEWLAAPDHPGLLAAPVVILPLADREAYVRRYAEGDKAGPIAAGASAGDRVGPTRKSEETQRRNAPVGFQSLSAEGVARPGAATNRRPGAATSRGPDGWDVPYWLTDTAFATMLLLLAAVEEGLGAAFVRLHRAPATTLAAFGVPDRCRALGAVILGWPHPEDRPGSSALRPRRPLAAQIHRGRW